MRFEPPSSRRTATIGAMMLIAAATLAGCGKRPSDAPKTATPTADKVELTDSQLKAITVQPIAERQFSNQRTAVGSIDFDEDRAVQVFPNYQGKIIQAFAAIGDPVTKGQPLYTIESPDLLQSESALVAAAGVYDLTTKALERDRKLHEAKGVADKDLDQATADQMSADAALKAARAAVRVFGKSDAEISRMIASRRIDPVLVVRSPIIGRVTARNAQPGLLVQPGGGTAPYAVADLSVMWMVANVAEVDSPLFRPGQPVNVKVMAFPDRDFSGFIAVTGASIDPSTHSQMIRSEIRDPHHDLRPGMLATYVITTGAPVAGLAIPADGVVREGDGTMNVWVTADGHHFTRRTVRIGLQRDNFDQIEAGLHAGERVVTRGGVFLSNMANADAAGS